MAKDTNEVIIHPFDYWKPGYEFKKAVVDAATEMNEREIQKITNDSDGIRIPILDRGYEHEALNLDCSYPLERMLTGLENYAAQLRAGKEKVQNCCMLFHGEPGTGKTEFGKYIAKRLGMNIYVRRGSDMLNCYVGETEKHIRRAFELAMKPNTVFLIDEADSFLASRKTADHQWEITEVNEFLCRMEEFRGILICTTNFDERLDDATSRRFTFKIGFKPLNRTGMRILAGSMLSEVCQMPPQLDELYELEGLTPGDFKAVRNRMLIVNPGRVSYEEALSELKLELEYRRKIADKRAKLPQRSADSGGVML